MNENKPKEGFSSIFGFLMVIIGFAVGVGSLWRFPYICGTNGGALFVIVYLIVIVVIGIPLLTAEIAMGYKTQKTSIEAYKELAPGKKWYWASYLHIAAALCIVSYTIPIYAWILSYIYRTASGFFVGMSPDQIGESFNALCGNYPEMFTFAIVEWVLVAVVVSRGLQNGVERINKILLPALAVIMIVCIIIGLRVDGAMEGVLYLIKPNFSTFSFNSVIAAVGQAFFAIGIGMLASMVFGSYIKNENEKLIKSSACICMAIVVAGLAAGFMIFPMVFAFGLEPSAGGGLTLITLPNVFNNIAAGRLIGTLFYVGFYFAAFTSAIGVVEAVVAVLMESGRMSRRKAVLCTMTVAVVIGSASIINLKIFDMFDLFTSNYLIVIGGLIISIFVGWIWGMDRFFEAINVQSALAKIWLKVSIKYICPVAILIIFLGNFVNF